MSICKNCKYWDSVNAIVGECDAIEAGDEKDATNGLAVIVPDTFDTVKLYGALFTNKYFGCNMFEAK